MLKGMSLIADKTNLINLCKVISKIITLSRNFWYGSKFRNPFETSKLNLFKMSELNLTVLAVEKSLCCEFNVINLADKSEGVNKEFGFWNDPRELTDDNESKHIAICCEIKTTKTNLKVVFKKLSLCVSYQFSFNFSL